jgi:hypothetical protein
MNMRTRMLQLSRAGTSRLLPALLICVLGTPHVLAQSADEMAEAAVTFLEALTEAQRDSAIFDFDDTEERHRWHFIPPEMFPRGGVTLKVLDDPQRELVSQLLMTGLSQRGYMTYTDIITLERILQAMQQGNFARDPEEYYLAVFGSPDIGGTWGWRFEGHHISLHFTVVAGEVSVSTPTFFGANPAVVRDGPNAGLRALGAKEDTGRALVMTLTAEQQEQIIISDVAPMDIITGNQYPIDPLSPVGLRADAMTEQQRQLLRDIVTAYSSQMEAGIARERWRKIDQDGFDTITFAWAGSVEVGAPHYYRVQGPSFLIEYDNTQNNANHIHSVWRDFTDDFGRDLLREHYGRGDHQHGNH